MPQVHPNSERPTCQHDTHHTFHVSSCFSLKVFGEPLQPLLAGKEEAYRCDLRATWLHGSALVDHLAKRSAERADIFNGLLPESAAHVSCIAKLQY